MTSRVLCISLQGPVKCGKKACSASVVTEMWGFCACPIALFHSLSYCILWKENNALISFFLVALSQLLNYSIKAFTFRRNACHVIVSISLTDRLSNKILVSFLKHFNFLRH